MSRIPDSPLRLLAALALCCGGLAGCSGQEEEARGPERYRQEPRPVRDGERAVGSPARPSGELLFQVLGVTHGIARTTGSHAEVDARRGQYVRVRLLVENKGRTTAGLDLGEQRLETSGGRSFSPDGPTMTLKRQPLSPELGGGVRLEFDLWYDIPAGLRPSGMVLLGGTPYTTAPPPAAEIPLP
ncbi:DUF4352 domain-containing protein [Actinocorallia populi]|uniref:DUF4352 domain-containing protein n=1 Tax=Actinocorallia populi TaxID=2079200 RepID=UPI000D089E7D|nr:DUF4352 domain-containing protein [Actinocorallia populi]